MKIILALLHYIDICLHCNLVIIECLHINILLTVLADKNKSVILMVLIVIISL